VNIYLTGEYNTVIHEEKYIFTESLKFSSRNYEFLLPSGGVLSANTAKGVRNDN